MEIFLSHSLTTVSDQVAPLFSYLKSSVSARIPQVNIQKLLELLSAEFHHKILFLLRSTQLLRQPAAEFTSLIDTGIGAILSYLTRFKQGSLFWLGSAR